MKKIISFASDFGLSDGSVGVVGVINRIDSELKINDISHGIPAQNIKRKFVIDEGYSVHSTGCLLVVDPGVGTERKLLLLKLIGRMIGPDNGLLNLACATSGAKRAYLLENEIGLSRVMGTPFMLEMYLLLLQWNCLRST